MKRLLRRQSSLRQEYYKFLVHQSFLELSKAEDHFKAQQFPASAASLFRSAEFFWKALTILTPDQFFREEHEADTKDIMKISDDLLSTNEKSKVLKILTHFPESRRTLAIYGYYEIGRSAKSPLEIFTKDDVERDLIQVRQLSSILKRIHFYEVSDPPIEVGVLSGYIDGPNGENRCSNYPYAGHRSADQWIEDLKQPTVSGKKLFNPVLVHISQLNTGQIPVVINPFGETIPEIKNGVNIGFNTIREYVRNGGILINVAGHPFIYGWDVTNNRRNPIIGPIPSIVGLQITSGGRVRVEEAQVWPSEALRLTETFHIKAAWDTPDIVGPQEVKARLCVEDLLEMQREMALNVFRPIKATGDIIPLLEAETAFWGKVYPAVATRHGRGTLVCFGLSLDGEREYRIVFDILLSIAIQGFQALV